MKIQSICLRDPAHGALTGQGHTLLVGTIIKSMDFDNHLFTIVLNNGMTYVVPSSNVRSAIVVAEEPNAETKQVKGK